MTGIPTIKQLFLCMLPCIFLMTTIIMTNRTKLNEILNNTEVVRTSKYQWCLYGHANDIPAVCENTGCLKRLSSVSKNTSEDNNEVVTKEQFWKQHIRKIDGWMSMDQYDYVRELTMMQWESGMYGSVGEIGVHHGRYASVLALNTDTDSGERLFFCDVFEKQQYNLDHSGRGNKEIFYSNMKLVGFTVDSPDPSRRLYVWADSSSYLRKETFLSMGLPAFRFFSIDGTHYDTMVYQEVMIVICIIRDGGIISFDDAASPSHPGVNKAIKDVVKMYGDQVLWPLIFVRNKMYATTKSWHLHYMRYIREHLAPKYNFHLCRDGLFGTERAYFALHQCGSIKL